MNDEFRNTVILHKTLYDRGITALTLILPHLALRMSESDELIPRQQEPFLFANRGRTRYIIPQETHDDPEIRVQLTDNSLQVRKSSLRCLL